MEPTPLPHSELANISPLPHCPHEHRHSFLRSCLLVAVVSFSLLSGCDDPSSVGLELVGGSKGEPIDFSVVPSTFLNEPGRDVTGARARVLVGVVDDPVAGSISAAGYLDFSPVGTRSEAFQNGPVTEVSLRLKTDYIYGDTLQEGSLFVYDIAAEFAELGFPADSTIDIGGVVTQTAFNPTDSLVIVNIPSNWIAVNDTTLRSSTAATAFHGFQLTATDVNSIVGFTSGSVMRVVSGGDSLDFQIELSATTSERLTPPTPSADRLIVQDTGGPTIGLDLELDTDTLSDAVINRIVLQLFTDVSLLETQTPSNFVRPPATSFDLIAVTKDSALVFLAVATVSEDGEVKFASDLLRTTYQGRLFDNSNVDHLRVSVSATEMGVGVGAFMTGSATEGKPIATLTVSRFQK